jgi:hypothetical protein
MEFSAARGRHGLQQRGADVTTVPPGSAETRPDFVDRGEGHDHHRHAGHQDHHGNGFGHGHFAMGMGRFIHEQMRAARHDITGEQIGEAVADLTARVGEVIGAAEQTPGIAVAQENFTAAIQDVVERFDGGEIGRRRAMAGFRAAFEDLVSAVRPESEDTEPAVDEVVAVEAGAGGVNTAAVGEAGLPATDETGGGGSLVENLGQVFNSFMTGLRSDLAALPGMRTFMSTENRDKLFQTFVDLYRELAAGDATESGAASDPSGIDQLV